MRSLDQTTSALKHSFKSVFSKASLLTAAIFTGASLNVAADHPIADTFTGLCPADTVGQTLNCTSSDIVIALVTAEDEGTKCLHGETATLNLNTQVEINAASARHDVAAWIPDTANLGKNMLLTSANGGPAVCNSKGFHFPIAADPDETGPIVVDDQDGDACGDVNGVNDVFTRPFTDATVNCDGTVGGAEVDAVVSWHLSGNDPVCSTHQDYGNFKKSKCSNTTSFVDLVVVGKLRVCKAASPDVDEDFEFTIEGGDVWEDGTGVDEVPTDATSPFYLNPIGDGLECMDFDVLTAQGDELNEVTITETNIPEGFSVSDVSCVNNADGGAPADFTDNGNGFTISLTEGNLGEPEGIPGQPDVTCTVTNTEGGSITIIKDAIPDSAQDFEFVESGAGTPLTNLGLLPVSLDDDADGTLSNTYVMDELSAGFYSITETPTPGWDTSVSCSGSIAFVEGDNFVNVDLESGDNFMCTFTNVQRGTIRVIKETFPADDPTLFTYTGDAAGDIADDGVIEVSNLVPGPYSSTEVVPAGWDLVSIACDDANSTGDVLSATDSFNVEPGETVTCVFTNVKQGTIIVQKTANGGDDSFTFNRSWGDDFVIDTSVDNTATFVNLPASDEVLEDTYAVDEDTSGLMAARWNFIGVACDMGEVNSAIDLDPGETVTCVFTNDKYARLTIAKAAVGGDDEFCFTVDEPNAEPYELCMETTDGNAESTEDNVDLGAWSIVENVELPWVLFDATCDNGDTPDSLDVAAGDDITCLFDNYIPNAVPVNNPWVLLLMILGILGAGWYFRPAISRNM